MRFAGKVGFGVSTEVRPGVFKDVITERSYFGDVVRNTRRSDPNQETVNNDISVGNSISVMADEYAFAHWHLIKYVEWEGQRWTVPLVELQRPRLLLSIGKVYNGPLPIPEEEEEEP